MSSKQKKTRSIGDMYEIVLSIFKEEIENFPASIPRLTDIPEPGRIVFPESKYVTGYISDDEIYAVKKINIKKMVKGENVPIDAIGQSINNEVKNYHDISTKCPDYFCKLLGFNYHGKEHILTIVMENCGVNLFNFYNGSKKPDHDSSPYPASLNVRNHIRQLLNILNCLHENDYVHFDLKLQNIVIDENGIIKLIDAESLTKIKDSKFPRVVVRGTYQYMAPEIKDILRHEEDGLITIKNDESLKATDIYSLGIIIIMMIFPFHDGIKNLYENQNYNNSDDSNDSDDSDNYYIYDEFANWLINWNKRENDKLTTKFVVNKINNQFKKFFGNKIDFEHFFSKEPDKRLTIQELIVMFEEKTEADRIEYEREEAKRIKAERIEAKRMKTERKKAELMKAKRMKTERHKNEIQEAYSANTGTNTGVNTYTNTGVNTYTNTGTNTGTESIFSRWLIGPLKRTFGRGGNKSKKSIQKHNNKSKRRQLK
jgi:serine/threonine protein kinase